MQAFVGSKFDQIMKILRTSLEGGDFSQGDRFASENELTARYGVSRNTVREAISVLVQEGFLTRTQGKGTFVTAHAVAPPPAALYAIFTHAHDHVFEAQTRALVRAFQQQGSLPLVFDTRDLKDPEQIEPLLNQLLDRGTEGLVLEKGVLESLCKLCAQRGIPLPSLAMLNRPAPADVPAVNIVTDFEYGTRLGTNHLLKLGHRKILFVCHANVYIPAGMRPDEHKSEYGHVVRGYTGALFDAGIAGNEHFFFIQHELAYGAAEREDLRRLLTGPDRPDAVFAYGDVRAKHVIDIAADAGLRVPEDLAVVGYWNTPWADMTRVPLTSVSIREDEIARLAVEKLTARRGRQKQRSETVVVNPELVIRASCGA